MAVPAAIRANAARPYQREFVPVKASAPTPVAGITLLYMIFSFSVISLGLV